MSGLLIAGLLVAGVALLFFGGEYLVKGAGALALRLGLSPLLVGLTVVAFGTSMPEMLVSLKAALSGNGAIAAGNVVGSNICNIALILGVSGLIRPMAVNAQVLTREIPIVILVSIGGAVFLSDFQMTRWEGGFLFAGIVLYLLIAYKFDSGNGKAESEAVPTELAEAVDVSEIRSQTGAQFVLKDLLLVALGLAGLVLGADLFVRGSVALARMFGVSEAVIGLTIVSVGTSLPELATSVVAAIRNQADIAIGNVVGSNVFNVLAILGLTSIVTPFSTEGVTWVDLSLMVGLALTLYPMAYWGRMLGRRRSAALLLVYSGYVAFLIQTQLV